MEKQPLEALSTLEKLQDELQDELKKFRRRYSGLLEVHPNIEKYYNLFEDDQPSRQFLDQIHTVFVQINFLMKNSRPQVIKKKLIS